MYSAQMNKTGGGVGGELAFAYRYGGSSMGMTSTVNADISNERLGKTSEFVCNETNDAAACGIRRDCDV